VTFVRASHVHKAVDGRYGYSAVEGLGRRSWEIPDDRMTRRGARLILPLPRPKYRGRQKVVVRSRLAAVCEMQIIACELQRCERAARSGDLCEDQKLASSCWLI
jgi:hypothetical protein